MKDNKILYYCFAVVMLGTFTGLLSSFGTNILASIGMFSLFWALMLTPMLGD
jgi:hypothetical protein